MSKKIKIENQENNDLKKQKIMTRRIIIVLILIVLILAGLIAKDRYEIWKEEELEKKARELYEQAISDKTPKPTETPIPIPEPTKMLEPTETSEPTETPKVIQEEFDTLRQEYNNDDIIGYVKIAGTSIDYPVVISSDNEYYLERDLMKNASSAGSIFMDYENDVTKYDKNIILYGHNMKADIMFHSIRNYKSEDFFQKHKYIIFNTIYEDYVWEVFSFYRTKTDFNYIQVIFNSDEEFYELAKEMKSRSIYDTGVDISIEDRILTLSTCTNETEDTRFVLNARLLTDSEEVKNALQIINNLK